MRAAGRAFDIAIVGSGFAGSLLAMIASRLGRSVVLLEKFKHPRFAIGESSTPLANLLLEELASRYGLSRLLPLAKWRSWQKSYPEVACGLKRGFTFYYHPFGTPFTAMPDRSNQLLVAASPHDRIADTHWYRADFDHLLVREAQSLGVEYLDEVSLGTPSWRGEEMVLEGDRHGKPLTIRAQFVVDATGPRGFLHRALKLPEAAFESMPATQGLYTHFTGVRRLADLIHHTPGESPPYPIDDAAVHHVFDGGWIWVLRFNNGLTSAGVAAVDKLAGELRFDEGEPAWRRLLRRLPTVEEQFAEAEPQLPFINARRLSFRSGIIAGDNWALIPSAAGFVDPLLSTGFPMTLLGIARLADAIERGWSCASFQTRLKSYATQTGNELLAASQLVGALYASMKDFELFTSISTLYFAAASFTEAARRLGRPLLAGAFLMHDHPFFGPKALSCLEQAAQDLDPARKKELMKEIRAVISPIDVAGLSDRERRNWYPVRASDILNASEKLGVNREQIEELLSRSGFWREEAVD